jgi:hypothetical protein
MHSQDDGMLIFASPLGFVGRVGVSLITQPKNAASDSSPMPGSSIPAS